jgi:hydroxymethylbilane synthase
MNRALEGSCQVPIAGYCEVVSSELWLRAWVGNALTGEFIQAESRGSISQADALGTSVAEQLFALGAADLLAQAAEKPGV